MRGRFFGLGAESGDGRGRDAMALTQRRSKVNIASAHVLTRPNPVYEPGTKPRLPACYRPPLQGPCTSYPMVHRMQPKNQSARPNSGLNSLSVPSSSSQAVSLQGMLLLSLPSHPDLAPALPSDSWASTNSICESSPPPPKTWSKRRMHKRVRPTHSSRLPTPHLPSLESHAQGPSLGPRRQYFRIALSHTFSCPPTGPPPCQRCLHTFPFSSLPSSRFSQIINESLPIFLDGAVSQVTLMSSDVN